MKAKNLTDVLVYHKAIAAQRAVSAFLKRSELRKDHDLWDQLSRSSARVPALIAEGFGQSTDYYGRARGSAYESYTHLITAKDREYITEEENAKEGEKYLEITKMLTPWINYLQRCNWRARGRPPQDAENSDS